MTHIINFVAWNEVCHLEEFINNHKNKILASLGPWETKHKIHGYVGPWKGGNEQ